MSGGDKRVAVAMSGGVDSSVTAVILSQRGYDVVGITLRFWKCDVSERMRSCCGIDGVEQARAVAGHIGVPHYVVDCRKEFEKLVLLPAWNEYNRGRTPNPCVLCNERIKFGSLLDHAFKLGATKLATGHHTRIVTGKRSGTLFLSRGRDRRKDQSYFMFSLTPRQLDRALTPIGELTKERVVEIAHDLGLPNADRPESQDACLTMEEGGFAEALRQRFGVSAKPGKVVDERGQPVGEHRGIHWFTIGQRRGLRVALGRRAWVKEIEPSAAQVVLTTNERELLSSELHACQVRWNPGFQGFRPGKRKVQIRYRHLPVEADVERGENGAARVRFDKPQKFVTPGQAAVFYVGDMVVGGGWIASVFKE